MYAGHTGHGAIDAQGERDQVKPFALEAARYVCRRLPGLPKTTFVKLLYLTDREYSRRHGHGLTGTRWWREAKGPLSSAVTKMLDESFSSDRTASPSGNTRIGYTDASAEDLRLLGGPEIAVIETVLAEFGHLGLVELLDRVHALPEVVAAKLKDEIKLPAKPEVKTSDYISNLLAEIAREDAAGIYAYSVEDMTMENAERDRDALAFARAAR